MQDEASTTRSSARIEQATVLLTALATFVFELVLAERKYGLFTGGFGQSHALRTPAEIASFLLLAFAAHLLVATALALALYRLTRRRWHPYVRRFLSVAVTGGVAVTLVIAKFELLTYFSDAVSFQLLAKLGGGSLVDAMLFSLSEAALFGEVIAAAALAIGAGLWLAIRFARRRPAARQAPMAGRGLLVAALCLPVAATAASGNADVRYAADRVTAYGLIRRALDAATDFDRDGYGLFGAMVDRAPFDPARHPLAYDIAGNGIDEDGFGGDFHAPASLPAEPPATTPARAKHLVLVVLESTRADILTKVIDGRPVASNLRALAAAGSHAPQAYSHVGFTTDSLKALFTGRLVPGPGAPSLFRDLKSAGYRIAVFSGQPEDFGGISAATGMRGAADVFVDAETLKADRAFGFAAQSSLLVDEGKLLGQFDRRLATGWDRPTFAYLNFQSAHFPYHHPGMRDPIDPHPLPRADIAPANRAALERTYWNAVAYADSRLGELVARLKALGVWNDTLLVVTADHGEALFDDGFLGHGHIIDPQQTHIPLVLNRANVDLSAPVGLTDYRALILAQLGRRAGRPATGPVFHHIGDLEAPAAIGITEGEGRQTVLDLESRTVRSGATTADYDTLAGPARAQADRLVAEWERQRWLKRQGR